MKKLLTFLCVIGGLYYGVGSCLVDSGTKSLTATSVKLAQLGE